MYRKLFPYSLLRKITVKQNNPKYYSGVLNYLTALFVFINDFLKYTLDVILGFLTDISCTYICTRMYTRMYKYKNTTMFQNMCEFLSFENFAGRKYRLTSYPCNIKMEVLIVKM